MTGATVRYIVNDVDEAIDFYCQRLGFELTMHPAPPFAMLSRGGLRLLLSQPGAGPGGGQATSDGTMPEPGGWNRFSLQIEDLESAVSVLKQAGAVFRTDIVIGVGGMQVVLEDPSGNPVELFQPTIQEARQDPE